MIFGNFQKYFLRYAFIITYIFVYFMNILQFIHLFADKPMCLSVFLWPEYLSSAFGMFAMFAVEEDGGEKYFCDYLRNRAKTLCANCSSV